MISGDLTQEEGPDWREAEWTSELKENKYWRYAKNNLTAKGEPDPGGERAVFAQAWKHLGCRYQMCSEPLWAEENPQH